MCTGKMHLPGARSLSAGVGGVEPLMGVVGTAGPLAPLARPLDRKSSTTGEKRVVPVS